MKITQQLLVFAVLVFSSITPHLCADDKMIFKKRSDCRYYILKTRGSDVLLECVLNKMYTLPQWQGPPDFETYIHQGNATFNPKLTIVKEKRIRLDNDRNLVIESVKGSDNGMYKCFHTEGGRCMFELVVTDPVNITDAENTTGYERVSKPMPPQNNEVVAGIVTAVVLVLVCAVIIVCCVWREKKTLKTKCCRQKPHINQDTPGSAGNEEASLVDVHSMHRDTPGSAGNEEASLVDVHSMHRESNFSAEELKIVKLLQQDLIIYYRKEFSKLQLSPLFEEEGYAAEFFDFYVKPNITILSHQSSKGQSKSRPVPFHDIFNCNSGQHIYISSPAGCGKTAFAKYLALIWCQAHLHVKSNNNSFIEEDIVEMQKFMFLFFVFLRDEYEQECDVDIMIQNQLIPKLANSTTYTELGLKFLQNLLKNVKCIIILDGLDEWKHAPGNECMLHTKQIPYIRARPLCTTVITSRPWKLDVVRIKPGDIDQKLEINGLEDVLLQRLIRNVVKKLNELRGKEMQPYKDMKADDFEQELNNKKLTDLSKIPIVVMQLLTVWFDNEPLGKSQCEIYLNMIEFLLERYCKKREIVSEMKDIAVDDCSGDRPIPMCLQKKMYCTVQIEFLSKLTTLAYNTLFTDHKEPSLVFDRSIAKKYLTDTEIEMSLAVGILTQEKVLGKMSKRQSHISFIHKTFQEYLAALYAVFSPGSVTQVEEQIKHVCCSIEKILDMSQVFMFVSGLCPEVMVNLQEHLRQTVSEDSRTQTYRASCELDVESCEGQTLERVQDTIVEWLGECSLNGHKHVTHFPVSDFFIWSTNRWSDELKLLTLHNPVYSLFVNGEVSPLYEFNNYDKVYIEKRRHYSPEEIENILNSVTVFNSIQKLWLFKVSEFFVVQLVSQHQRSVSIKPETWRHLGYVTLDALTMSGDILCLLVDSILQLPNTVWVRLQYCRIRQVTRDWKAYVLSHPLLTVDEYLTNDSLLKFHTNKV